MSTPDLPPPIDPAAIENLREIGGGSDEFVAEIAQMFREDTPPRLDEVEECRACGDAARLSKAAHSLKGSASNFGAVRFRSIAEQLEHLGKTGDLSTVSEALQNLRSEFARILAALDAVLKKAP